MRFLILLLSRNSIFCCCIMSLTPFLEKERKSILPLSPSCLTCRGSISSSPTGHANTGALQWDGESSTSAGIVVYTSERAAKSLVGYSIAWARSILRSYYSPSILMSSFTKWHLHLQGIWSLRLCIHKLSLLCQYVPWFLCGMIQWLMPRISVYY